MLDQWDPYCSENQLSCCEVRNVDDDDDDNNNNNKCSVCHCTTCLFPLSLFQSAFQVSKFPKVQQQGRRFFFLSQNAATVNQLLCPRAGDRVCPCDWSNQQRPLGGINRAADPPRYCRPFVITRVVTNSIHGTWVSDTRLAYEWKTHAELRVLFITDPREVPKNVSYVLRLYLWLSQRCSWRSDFSAMWRLVDK